MISGRVSTQGGYGALFHTLQYRAWIVIGAALSTSFLLLRSVYDDPSTGANRAAIQAFTCSPLVLKGLCLSVSFSFFATELGKLANDSIMREFFQQSGYALWFMYSIMALEILGASALFVSKMIVPAASGLTMLMLGAIFTHYRNGDPFADSLEALHLLIILLCIMVICRLRSAKHP